MFICAPPPLSQVVINGGFESLLPSNYLIIQRYPHEDDSIYW